MALFGKITADSFGSDLPSNWEELADHMNGVATMRLEQLRNERQGELDPREESDVYDCGVQILTRTERNLYDEMQLLQHTKAYVSML